MIKVEFTFLFWTCLNIRLKEILLYGKNFRKLLQVMWSIQNKNTCPETDVLNFKPETSCKKKAAKIDVLFWEGNLVNLGQLISIWNSSFDVWRFSLTFQAASNRMRYPTWEPNMVSNSSATRWATLELMAARIQKNISASWWWKTHLKNISQIRSFPQGSGWK